MQAISWTQRIPAGLPWDIPGIGEEIDGAMQQALQPTRHSMPLLYTGRRCSTFIEAEFLSDGPGAITVELGF